MEKASSRLRVLALLVALMFVALSTRLWFLQVLATQRFEKEARDNSARLVYTDPLRGQIYDASGRLLVVNQESLELRITPDLLGNEGEAVVGRVAKLTNVPIADIVSKLQDNRYLPSQAIPIAEFVPEEIRTTAEEEIARFKSGEETIYTIFTGPIADQAGEIRVPEGQSMTDEELLSMNWFVEGVEGEIPS